MARPESSECVVKYRTLFPPPSFEGHVSKAKSADLVSLFEGRAGGSYHARINTLGACNCSIGGTMGNEAHTHLLSWALHTFLHFPPMKTRSEEHAKLLLRLIGLWAEISAKCWAYFFQTWVLARAQRTLHGVEPGWKLCFRKPPLRHARRWGRCGKA